MHEEFLVSGEYVNSDHSDVIDYAHENIGKATTDLDKVLNLYYAIRDGIRYDPYLPINDPASYRASDVLSRGRGWCVPKAALMAACARIHGIPARPGFADVVNHLATEQFLESLGDDIFYWHAYCEMFLDGKWVKATPAFNKELCDKFGLKPLEFDGKTDSLFHEFDKAGNKHMEYLNDRGPFLDVPFEDILATFREKYRAEWVEGPGGDFEAEAEAENKAGA
ncbi:MAG: transglutaminase-like domain-containing protein [Proteobacteria bacterium]|nr:transglutaminase-like domain-containing protein [Pseudomonadota bacterium]